MHRCSSHNNDTNNNSDNNHGKRDDEHQESALATGKILSQALSKDLPEGARNGSDKYRMLGEATKMHHHVNGAHNNQSVIRSLKSERSSTTTPPSTPTSEAAQSSPSSTRHPAHSSNNNYPHPHHQQPQHQQQQQPQTTTMNHSNSSAAPPQHGPSSRANQSPIHNHHSSTPSQRGSPPNPSHQHVTVLVNPSRPKAADHQQPMIQHHQTTIVGIRRSSPPANISSSPMGQGPYSLGQHGNNFREVMTSNGGSTSSFSSAMMQAMAPQNHLHNSSMRNSSQMSPNSSSSPSNNSQHSNGGMHHSNGNHSLLAAAAAQGQLQIPLQLLQQQHQHQMRIKRERSPIHGLPHGQAPQTMTGGNAISLSPLQHKQQQQHLQSQSPSQLNSMPMMNPNLQMRHPMRDAAILLRVKNEMPNLAQVQQRMVWNANARINGVKPEIIGGPLPNMRPNGSNQATSPPQSASQTPPRATPTVIMGESCGVRTMVWGFEPSNAQMPPSPASSSSNQSSVGPSQNEEAAQLLLSLGQGSSRPNDIRPRTTAQRSPHPLNMERLWAGDYSQLPAGQQLHALNLSQPQWMGGGAGPPGTKVRKQFILNPTRDSFSTISLSHFNRPV